MKNIVLLVLSLMIISGCTKKADSPQAPAESPAEAQVTPQPGPAPTPEDPNTTPSPTPAPAESDAVSPESSQGAENAPNS